MRTLNIKRPTSNVELKRMRPPLHFSARNGVFDIRCSAFFLVACLLCFSKLSAVPSTQPTTLPVTQPTATNLQVQECSIFVLDASTGQINPDGVVTATLPVFISDHRYGSASVPAVVEQRQFNNNFMFFNGRMIPMGGGGGAVIQHDHDASADAPLDEPSPVGLIRLIGSTDSKVDVSIMSKPGGNFVASWPKAEDRPNQLLWRDLSLAEQPATPLTPLDNQNWFTTLRSAKGTYLSMEHSPTEKFLLYDLQMKYDCKLKIKSGSDNLVDVTNTGNVPLHDVMLFRDGKEVGVGDLDAAPKPVKSTTASATTGPVPHNSATLQLGTRPTSQPSVPLWYNRMIAAGVDPAEAQMINRLMSRYVYDKRMTAVYVLDDAEFDRLEPMEVVPQPSKISRFGLVIVLNVDPAAGNIVDDLIKQLGDEDWSKRDSAYRALATMGPAATAKLNTAKSDKDLEIAWRAERLLALNPQPPKP
jgi:hypothetical protein